MGHKFIENGKSHETPAFTEILKDKSFCEDGKIFTFNTQKNTYIAKVKNNQKLLKDKVILISNNFAQPIETYEDRRHIFSLILSSFLG